MIEDSGRTGGRFGHRGTAFYIEALLLTGVLAAVVLMLAGVFVRARQMGKEAALLTDAVHLAENAAEAVAASKSLEEVRGLLEENGNGQILPGSSQGGDSGVLGSASGGDGWDLLRLYYDNDLKPVSEGTIWMEIRWMPEDPEKPETPEESPEGASKKAGLVRSVITVNRTGRAEPVYTIETEVFVGLD